MNIIVHHENETAPPSTYESTIPAKQWRPELAYDIAERLIVGTECATPHVKVEFYDGEVLYNSYTREDFPQ